MISIIIPTYNEEGYIERTLRNLESLPRDAFEVIVSDSRSTDGTATIAARMPGVTVAVMPPEEKRGISQGRNDGARIARGEFFVFIDADVTIPDPPAFFADLLNTFHRDPNLVGIIVPQWVERENETTADRVVFTMLNSFYRIVNNVFHVGNASGEFQMIRRDQFKKLGGFRLDLAAGEDNDMFRRLAKLGRTEMYWKRPVYHTGRRAHKIGWPRVLYAWLKNGIVVAVSGKSPYKEWESIR